MQVRELNLHEEGDETHYGQTLENVTLKRCWTELLASANVDDRKENVKKFNELDKIFAINHMCEVNSKWASLLCQIQLFVSMIINCSQNKWKKRGLAVTALKYGICFPLKFLNQVHWVVHFKIKISYSGL